MTSEQERTIRMLYFALKGMVRKYACRINSSRYGGRLVLSPGGTPALKDAFDALAWDDEYLVPELECEWEGDLHKPGTWAMRTLRGYKRVCDENHREIGPLG